LSQALIERHRTATPGTADLDSLWTAMAQPFIALGLKGANFLVDKHFHKVPDAALHPETYHPANLTSKQRRKQTAEKRKKKNERARNENSNSSSSSDNENDDTNLNSLEDQDRGASPVDKLSEDIQQRPERGAPRSMFSPPPTRTYSPQSYVSPQQQMYDGPPIYSREPPHLRPNTHRLLLRSAPDIRMLKEHTHRRHFNRRVLRGSRGGIHMVMRIITLILSEDRDGRRR